MTALRLSCLVALATALAACAHQRPSPGADAVAVLESKSGSETAGLVKFAQAGHKVYVTAVITGLKPNAEHGFHVHEKGDCSSFDAASAGGHFNPVGSAHGHLSGDHHHAGDMPNLKTDAQGKATVQFEVDSVTIGSGAPNDILGKAIIVHRDADDYKSQPVGNAGPRVACAVIRKD
jgi:Cu-Zn family superoxide dismutase